jgi:hypothetical protein
MSDPNGFVVYIYSFREMKRMYVKSINESMEYSFVDEVEYTEDKSEALTHDTYESARYGTAGVDHLEYCHVGEFFHIERK